MKKVFITVNGSVEIERNIIFIKIKKSHFFETGFARIAFALLPVIGLLIVLIWEHDPFKFFRRTVMFGLWTIVRIPFLYKALIKTSYSKRIPLEKITSAEIEEDPNGLETKVLLYLTNNRVRKIVFRTMEKQYDDFLAELKIPNPNLSIA
jgi:hypothetical protein